MSDETRRLVDEYALAEMNFTHERSYDVANKKRKNSRAALDAHLARLEAVVEAAGEVNAYCDYIVKGGHEDDEHDPDCAKCRMEAALRALGAK